MVYIEVQRKGDKGLIPEKRRRRRKQEKKDHILTDRC